MRRALLLGSAGLALACAVAPATSASQQTSLAFGRSGGNIRPYTVTIAADGRVTISGPVQARRTKLTRAQVGGLIKLAADVRFATLPKTTNCTGALPDVASTFVRVGARTVRVHGNCIPRYARLLKALGSAVKLSF
jgi:hypothetical protein